MNTTNDIIHTTGALLRPQKVTDSSGNEIWILAVVEFTADSYKMEKFLIRLK